VSQLKAFVGQTAVYGLSTIVARIINYCLTPLYLYIFRDPKIFSVIPMLFSYTAFFNVFLTYGMETAFFYFSRKYDREKVYNTAFASLIVSTSIFLIVFVLNLSFFSSYLRLEDHSNYILWMILIIATDIICTIPFASMRSEGKAKKFALIKTINIIVNVLLNLFFFWVCKSAYEAQQLNPETTSIFANFYNPKIGIGYAFLCQLIANIVMLILVSNYFLKFKFNLDKILLKEMLRYSAPLLIVGMAGMVNETFDRLVLTQILPIGEGEMQNGIYGANYRLAMLMTIFVQAFRFGAEPFFFKNEQDKDSKKHTALILKYFVIACTIIFISTCANLPWIKHFMPENYWSGLKAVPILLLANLFLGVYYNLSVWFRLSNKTTYGAIITVFGAIITVAINLLFIPKYGYMACAWATLITYGVMVIVSYLLGQKYYPINYNLRAIFFFFFLGMLLYVGIYFIHKIENFYLNQIFSNLCVAIFLFAFYKLEWQNLKKLRTAS
jgi:O-antigen/teichoic acid export membrane protein